MRKTFQELLLKEMMTDDSIYLLLGDLGYKVFDNHQASFPDRVFNVGAAEQSMLDIAVGLALEGKKPYCYSITPFLIFRPFETLRIYLNHEKVPVRLIGSGRDQDYMHDGITHYAHDVGPVLDALPNIKQYYPNNIEEVKDVFKKTLEDKPCFVSLKR